ncbi:protein Aster-B-like [Haliotis cracherodii]|uniref:protein Aster-B-like n=1 Tax=Haliotis cracherodii TaxID=6455 RepID=UPI0039E90234
MSRYNRKTLLEISKSNSSPEGFDKYREGSEPREFVGGKQTTSVESVYNCKYQRLSPQPHKRHRRSRDLTPASSQESLHMAGGAPSPSGRDSLIIYSTSEIRDDERRKSSTDISCRPQNTTIEEDPRETTLDEPESPSNSDKVNGNVDNASEDSGADNKEHSPQVSFDNGSPMDDRTADRRIYAMDGESLSEKERLPNRHAREKSFERSLDNIMDKCSEKSLDLNLSVESWNGSMSDASCRSPDNSLVTGSTSLKYSKNEKKKKSAWYTMLAPSYKTKTDDFRKTFKDIPHEERLIVDYSCALQKDILVQGRMYITQNWICFYANIFRWETVLTIQCKEITAVTKEKTARVIPNAIAITTEREKYFFTSFGARDKTFMMLFRIWQNALLDQPMSPKELWQWIHYSYGEELGLTSSDDDYVPPPGMDDLRERLSKEEIMPPKGELGQLISNDDTDVLVSDEVFCQLPVSLDSPLGIRGTEVPTDFGDTTEDSEGEVTCSGHEHLEKCYLDEVFNLSVDQAFEYLFTDSAFFRQFVASRKTFELELPEWSEVDENGSRARIIHYTLTLNHSIGPKTSPSEEKQTCMKDSEPGLMYLIDTDCMNGGIPYADAFFVANRYCLTRVSKNKCRIHVSSEVRYKKSVIGIVKGMIERSAVGGLTDYFRALSAHLRREAERQETISNSQKPAKKKLRRRRKIVGNTSEVVMPLRQPERQMSAPPSPVKHMGNRDMKLSVNAESFVRLIFFILAVLVVLNAILFFKVWCLEDIVRQRYLHHTAKDFDNVAEYPRSQEQWANLLNQQKSLYNREIDKWSDVLATSIQLIEQMKGTLETLRDGLEMRNADRKSKS